MEAITCTITKDWSREGKKSDISGFLQKTCLGSKTQRQVEAYPRSEFPEQIS